MICTQATHAFTSYTYNGYETDSNSIPRITGKKLSAIKKSAQAVLVGEWPAYFGGSWHPFRNGAYPGAKCVLSFADGHVGYLKIFWDGITGLQPRSYEPPTSYDYSWDGE